MEDLEEVVVKKGKYYDKTGYISGVSSENNILLSYAVFLFCSSRVVMFSPSEVRKTGKKFSKKDFFTGDTIKVTRKGNLIK